MSESDYYFAALCTLTVLNWEALFLLKPNKVSTYGYKLELTCHGSYIEQFKISVAKTKPHDVSHRLT